MPHFQRPRFNWGDCEDPDFLALTAATQLPPDRPVSHHISITEPSWLPRQNSFGSDYSKCSNHDASEPGYSEFTDDYHVACHSPSDVPEAIASHHPDFVLPPEAPTTLGRWLLLLGRRARRVSGYF